jgi:cell volume regulation protein A
MKTMADPATVILTDIALVLTLGILLSLLAKKMNIPNVLLLVLAGIGLGILAEGTPRFAFSNVFLVSIGMFTLAIIVFNGTSKFSLRDFDHFSLSVLKFILAFLLSNAIFVTVAVVFLFFGDWNVYTILFSLLFSILMIATDSGSIFIMFNGKHRVVEFLEMESILNDPFMVVLPFILLTIIKNIEGASVTAAIVAQFVPFLQQIIVGVGAGVVVGVVMLKVMKRFYSVEYSPAGLIAATLLAYIIAENLKGNGVLAVATLGLLFGNSYIREKEILQGFNEILDNTFVVIVFILIGVIVKIDFSWLFLFKAFLLFLVMVVARYIAIAFSLRDSEFTFSEKVFMAFSMPKGIAAAVVAFSLSVFGATPELSPYMTVILQLSLISMVYSLVIGTVMARLAPHVLGKMEPRGDEKEKKEEAVEKKEPKKPAANGKK